VALPGACVVRGRLSRLVTRQAREEAAREFATRRNEVFLINPDGTPKELKPARGRAKQPEAPVEVGLPEPGSTLDVEQSKELLRRLASGELKQVRRR